MSLIQKQPTEEQLRELIEPVTFCEKLLFFQGKPFKLYPWQKKVAREIDILTQRVCFQKGRQTGGSMLCGALIARAAFITPNSRFLICSATQNQAGFIYGYARAFIETSPYLRESIDKKRSTKFDFRLKNGALIYARTVNHDASSLRGETLSSNGCLCLDESSYIRSDAHETLVHIAHNAGILHCSTPRRKIGSFWDACNNKHFKVYRVAAYDSPRIRSEDIAELKKTLRPSQFKTDVLGQFAAGENSVFDSDSIDKAINSDLPLFDAEDFDVNHFPRKKDNAYVYSLDVARSSATDRWVLTIGDYDREFNTLKVVAYAAWSGLKSKHDNVIKTDDPRKIISDILLFRKRFPVYKLYVDVTANEFFADHLQNEYLFPVEKIHWSQARKQLLLEHLATALRAEKIQIPNDNIILSQLMDMAYDLKRMEDDSDKKIYLAGDDDFVDSLAMLSQVITTEPKYKYVDYLEVW